MKRTAYPRPELVRDNWINLNGEWEFEFDFSKTGKEQKYFEKEYFENTIVVPFCPESRLSKIGYKDFINSCWYKKQINLNKIEGQRTLLNFEAAYYLTEVYINGKSIGTHSGGYTPFSFDITDYIVDGENTIIVNCQGDSRDTSQPSGKQSPKFNSYGCMYTRTTGIWQTVWIENVPETYLKKLFLDPDIYSSTLAVRLYFSLLGEKTIKLQAKLGDSVVGEKIIKTSSSYLNTVIDISELSLWEIENPVLYDLFIEIEADGKTDKIQTYFGMRDVSLSKTGVQINGKPVFMRLVLDQGFYPDGIYTAPSDDDLLNDIKLSQRMGFNGARLHEKVFERRFLYEADKNGYIVWGEYPNWGFDTSRIDGLQYYLTEWLESMERDFNHPALIGWCPFNETWDCNGRQQNDLFVLRVYEETKRFDPKRPVIDTSGNYHVKTDIYDIHDYQQNTEMYENRYKEFVGNEVFDNYSKRQSYNGEPYFVSEYGGIKWADPSEGWGYGNAPQSLDEYVDRYIRLTKALMGNKRVCGLCYTQLYDVEQEKNGIYYYNRTSKFDDEILDKMRDCMLETAEYEK